MFTDEVKFCLCKLYYGLLTSLFPMETLMKHSTALSKLVDFSGFEQNTLSIQL